MQKEWPAAIGNRFEAGELLSLMPCKLICHVGFIYIMTLNIYVGENQVKICKKFVSQVTCADFKAATTRLGGLKSWKLNYALSNTNGKINKQNMWWVC